ncbi:MAG: ribbon-helix-helix protein, CopG family [SAR202 cluster bacterium]|nr:ribbon-helix-helix protein, CopG family [SAR202 cluster bacterium]
MGRTTKTITISIPPEMEQQIEELMRLEGRTRSELLREALRRYADDRRLRFLSQEIGQRVREAGITSEEQINELIHAQRRSRG